MPTDLSSRILAFLDDKRAIDQGSTAAKIAEGVGCTEAEAEAQLIELERAGRAHRQQGENWHIGRAETFEIDQS